jgi:serine/threonine protein phosphatase PrpC
VANFIQKLLSKRHPSAETHPAPGKLAEIPTVPVITERPDLSSISVAPLPVLAPLSPAQLLSSCGHSIGRQRDHNEDALFTLTTTLMADSHTVPFGLYIVADGMGGHRHGEIASGIAIRAMASYIIRHVYAPLFSLASSTPEKSLQEIMQEGVQAAHRGILKQMPGSGTTLTALLVMGDQMTVAHVGDSRAYSLTPDGQLTVLTRDHSLVKRLEELGQITPEEAAVHPQRNVLYRALGQGEAFDAEVISSPLPEAGFLLLCSDGLWGLVPEDEMIATILGSESLSLACQRMVNAANAAGGPDNITAVLVRLPD